MFFRINERNIVNLRDISYVSVDMNQEGMWELRIFLKQVEHYMYVQYVYEEDAMFAFEALIVKLNEVRGANARRAQEEAEEANEEE